MNLKPCRDCGHNCSTHGLMCPACGRLIGGRAWWANTIGLGVIQSAIISFVLTAILFVALKIWLPIF